MPKGNTKMRSHRPKRRHKFLPGRKIVPVNTGPGWKKYMLIAELWMAKVVWLARALCGANCPVQTTTGLKLFYTSTKRNAETSLAHSQSLIATCKPAAKLPPNTVFNH